MSAAPGGPGWRRVLAALALIALVQPTLAAPTTHAAAPAGMARIAAGAFALRYAAPGDPPAAIAAFYLDVHPVTNAEFLDFVRARPEWRRSAVPRLFASEAYLGHWAGDLDLGPQAAALRDSPVTNVSWFAARAFAEWRGRRLPTLAEWEYAASADAAGKDADTQQRLLDWYGRPTRIPLPAVGSTAANAWGVWDLHGLVWEWVEDFNAVLLAGDTRASGSLESSLFCAGGAAGAADLADYAAFMRDAFRSSLAGRDCVASLGFRCARDLDANPTARREP